MFRFVIFSAFFVMSHCQVFGGPDNIGYRTDIYNGDRNKVSGYGQIYPNSPVSLGGGVDWKHANGHGAGLDVLNTPSTGMTGAKVSGQVGLVNTDRDRLYAFGSHSRTFDSHFNTVGRSSNAGLGISHTSRDGRTNVGAQAGATFIPGMKPQPGFNVGFTHNF